MGTDLMDAICQNLPFPCLILDKSRHVLAANDGMCRLTSRSPEVESRARLIGKAVDDLGFITIPTQSSTYRHIGALLDDCPFDINSTVLRQSGAQGLDDAKEEDFWDQEDRVVCVVMDIILQRAAPVQGQTPSVRLMQIRARMSVRHLWLADKPMYILTFERPRSELVPTDSRNAMAEQAGLDSLSGDDRSSRVPPQDASRITDKAIPYITATLDIDGQALEFSDLWYSFFGTTEKENLGTGWLDVIHPDDVRSLTIVREEAVKRNEDSWSQEARYRTKDASHRWCVFRAESSKNEAGMTARWYVSMMDIDELRRSCHEAEYWRASIMTLITNANVCLWGLTPDRSLFLKAGSLSWDPVLILDRRSDDVNTVHNSKDDLQSTASIDSIEDAVNAVSNGRFAALRLDHKNFDRCYQSTLVADYHHTPKENQNQSRAVLGLTIDTTDAKARAQLEVENASVVEKERVASRLSESKSRFLANTSHELRTPIAGIIGLNNLLKESLSEKTQREFSDSINLSAGLLLTLVNDVLDLSKIEAGRMDIEAVPFTVSRLVNTVRSVMTVQADQKGLDFQVIYADVPLGLAIVGDPNRLQQVLLNLLSNSIKFTKTGSVTMTVLLIPSGKTLGKNQSHAFDGHSKTPPSELHDTVDLSFVVEDTGCGMDTNTITKSFEAFSQANVSIARQYGGTGLGLTISRQLVDMMGGSLQLTSTPSVGTTASFQITFPLVKTSSNDDEPPGMSKATFDISHEIRKAGVNVGVETIDAVSRTASRISSEVQQFESRDGLTPIERKERLVLITDDNELTLKIAVLMTKKLGFQVISAQNGKEALDTLTSRVESDLPLPDVVLMDCMMPIKDGYEATQDLRGKDEALPASLRNIPVVALTAYATKNEQQKCLDAGMDDYLSKPLDKTALQDALDKWCLSGRT